MRCDGGHRKDTRLLDMVSIIGHIVITGSRILRKQLLVNRVWNAVVANSLTNAGTRMALALANILPLAVL